MGKKLFIAEKPSVAQEFAKALKVNGARKDGYLETDSYIITWCVGHLITMSYPESYDEALKKWSLATVPFIPEEYKYEVIPAVSKQFKIVSGLLNRDDVDTIYVCTDSGREGEYIYRLVDQMAKVPATKDKRRVWIDSQTEEEILRGINEAKPLSEYNNLSDSAYLRAKEDYLMGINFSRVLSLKYGYKVKDFLGTDKSSAISVGRVMTCVLGMVVRRERQIREFVKTPFYRVLANLGVGEGSFDAEWRVQGKSQFYNSPALYKENGFKEKEVAMGFVDRLNGMTMEDGRLRATVLDVDKKKENKQAPLLFNLAELQNVCSKLFKISPDETLKITQELYEKKLVTYPRTDARVLSTAVCKEIYKNISGLKNYGPASAFASEVLQTGNYKNIAKTKYCNDKQITDHYAIIPTGQGLNALQGLGSTASGVYNLIVKRFLSIFYPPAVYYKVAIKAGIGDEHFFASFKILKEEGYMKVAGVPKTEKKASAEGENQDKDNGEDSQSEVTDNAALIDLVSNLTKGMLVDVNNLFIKEGETSPPKRYTSGTLILAMENAGQLIEDEELRSQIKSSGIGTSATRAEILNKLVRIKYLDLKKKTQVITPTELGELIYEVVNCSIRSLLNPELTASWEKGLTYVAEGTITEEEYLVKLNTFVAKMTNGVKEQDNSQVLRHNFAVVAKNYTK